MSKSLDRLTLLATFARIAERGSISAAARDLGLSQASASRQLADLEARLGADLMRRTTHSLSLTAAGVACLADARTLLDGWEHFEENHKSSNDGLSGSLSVIAPVALGQTALADAAINFQQVHKGVSLSWQLDDSEIRFAERGCDIWLRVGEPKDDSLIVRPLGRIERLLVTAPNVANELQPAAPIDLNEAPFVALSAFDGAVVTLSNSTGKNVTIEGTPVLTSNNIFASYRAAKAGLGVAVMPKWFVANDLAAGSLIDLLPDWRAPSLTLNTAYLPSKWQPRRLRLFNEFIEAAIQKTDGIEA